MSVLDPRSIPPAEEFVYRISDVLNSLDRYVQDNMERALTLSMQKETALDRGRIRDAIAYEQEIDVVDATVEAFKLARAAVETQTRVGMDIPRRKEK